MSIAYPALPSPNNIIQSTAQDLPSYQTEQDKRRRPRKPRNPVTNEPSGSIDTSSRPTERLRSQQAQNRPKRRNPQRKDVGRDEALVSREITAEHPSRSSPVKRVQWQERRANESGGDRGALRGTGRRKQINARLTNQDADERSESAPTLSQKQQVKADNLTNRLINALRKPPFADCPICFNAIHPGQPIWSCSPTGSRPSSSDSSETGDSQYCYTPFHLKCIKSWASKSVKDMREAYIARGERDKQGEWRCPGCQRKRSYVPSAYLCFCGSMQDPKPPRLATPHSCGNSCSRLRNCNHACSLSCHPGPCPPCQITTQLPCHCGRQTKSFRCAEITSLQSNGKPAPELSCGVMCNKLLICGKHRCSNACHPGTCDECPIVETTRCYCGRTTKQLNCGEGEEKHSACQNEAGLLEEWDGRFACENRCGRPFDCGVHGCQRPCHPPSIKFAPCPLSPKFITHCPCGKKALEDGLRKSCTDPVATCKSTCMKKLEGCEHACSSPCHNGKCPPCLISLIMPCRCGLTTRAVKCYEYTSNSSFEILCDKPCAAIRTCGRHRCNRQCCPLFNLDTGTRGKGKKRQTQAEGNQDLDFGLTEWAGWHECDLTCGKLLGCGNHRYEAKDHRGACPPCLRSSFEELTCYCGRTVIEPPVPCGMRINCTYPCSRPPPPCGHPKTPHTCHEDPTPCPPCPSLTTKQCACGKTSVRNVRCSQKNVSCGTPCGKLLDCGFHHCERLCHSGDCGTCTSVCGKPRRSCLPAYHGCNALCHAPAACSEDEPCRVTIILHCPCGRLQQPSVCARSSSNPSGREGRQQLKCTNDCAIARRNARLAEALGISQEVRDRDGPWPVTYSSDLITFTQTNAKFCADVERIFADFVGSERKLQVLPHMHEGRRKFIHDLAVIYRMDTQMVDQEPKRSVQLIRRIDTRIPKPLLSSVANPHSNLSKLTDLRSSGTPQTRPSSAASNNGPPPASERVWTSVVAASSAPQAPSSGWDAPQRQSGSNRPRPTANGRGSNTTKLTSNGPTTQQVDEQIPDNWENDEA